MSFWSTQKILAAQSRVKLFEPDETVKVEQGAIHLSLGDKHFVTSDLTEKPGVLTATNIEVVIPAGQFGVLTTHESVALPTNVIGFISIRFRKKLAGLVNVSGFHVDPGYEGPLLFSVYNAGSQPIRIDRREQVFLLWLADLDAVDEKPYVGKAAKLDSEVISRIHGEVASPAELQNQLRELKGRVDYFDKLKWLIYAGLVAVIAKYGFEPAYRVITEPKQTCVAEAPASTTSTDSMPASPAVKPDSAIIKPASEGAKP